MIEKLTTLKAEFYGTLILFTTAFSLTQLQNIKFDSPYVIPILIGLALAIGIMLFGKISGANFNPGVTINQVAAKNIEELEANNYFLGQVLGGFAALLIVLLISSFTGNKLVVYTTSSQFNILSFLKTAGYEFIAFSIFLIAIAFAKHKEMWKNALQVGGTLSIVIIAFGFINHSVHMNLIGEIPSILSIFVTKNWNILNDLIAVIIGQTTAALFIAKMFKN